jgi:hypothetical protein
MNEYFVDMRIIDEARRIGWKLVRHFDNDDAVIEYSSINAEIME